MKKRILLYGSFLCSALMFADLRAMDRIKGGDFYNCHDAAGLAQQVAFAIIKIVGKRYPQIRITKSAESSMNGNL